MVDGWTLIRFIDLVDLGDGMEARDDETAAGRGSNDGGHPDCDLG